MLPLPERYDPLLVALSYVVAVLGSFTALRLGARVSTPAGTLRPQWLTGGALAQGAGIWSMHFTGMLALSLPVPISYDVLLVILSYVVASGGALLSLLLTRRRTLGPPWMLAGALFLGTGISGLHYIDMAAMRMPADTRYSPVLVAASVVVACAFGILSLWLGRRHRRDDPRQPRWTIWLAGLAMGLAIFGQHYTGMAAASFYADPDAHSDTHRAVLPASKLPQAVLLSTLAILGAALSAAGVDRRRSARAIVSQRLLAAQESERRRIALSLHDDLGQILTVLRLNLQRLSAPKGEAAIVSDSMSLVDDALGRVRTLAVELRPSVLDDLGLAAALKWHAARVAERAGFAVTFENTFGAGRLPEAIETAAFRIAQQALTNIARHAHAQFVRVSLEGDPRCVELTIADDGAGFDVPAASAHAEAGESLGLLDMRETAILAGGTLAITSSPGRGSRVRAQFPLAD